MENKKNVPMELDDEALDTVAGGVDVVEWHQPEEDGTKYCECCGRRTVHIYGVLSIECSVCGKTEALY